MISGEASTLDNNDIVIGDRLFVATRRVSAGGGRRRAIDLNGVDAVSVSYGETVNGVVVATFAEFAAALAYKIDALPGFNAEAALTPAGQTITVASVGGTLAARPAP